MLASRVLITAGTPDSMYLEDRQEKWLGRERKVPDGDGMGCDLLRDERRI